MAGSTGANGEFGFQIAPMLDILFVLLLFFMVSAGAQKHEALLTTPLPSKSPVDSVTVQVGIDSDGQVDIYGAPIDSPTDHGLPQLIGRLKGVVQTNATQPIVITPSRTTHHQRVMDVLDACAAANVKNLAFGSPSD
jgi:biopolymer transport protein ExbD